MTTCPDPALHAVLHAELDKLAELLHAAIDLLDDNTDDARARLSKAVDKLS